MKFNKINILEWRQFKKIDIDFHSKVTIITGANGSGKSTILKILSKHFGWNLKFIGYDNSRNNLSLNPNINSPLNNFYLLGNIQYSNDMESKIGLNTLNNSNPQFDIEIKDQINIDGLHINSHRPATYYQKVENIPTTPINANEAYQGYLKETLKRFSEQTGISPLKFSPTYKLKESLISMAAFGSGNDIILGNETIEKLFTDFSKILVKVLPKELGFQNIKVIMPDVFLVTSTGSFLIDSSSGGIMSIIDLAWQLFLYSHNKNEFVVTIDEPENHLHPSMQRSLLNNFVEAFPNAQFIVVTHSPFIVSSIKDSNVYALKYEDFKNPDNTEQIEKKVVSHKLDLNEKATTAHEILREVLGVPVTLPQWAEEDLQRICSNFTAQDVTVAGLALLRSELDQAGLGEFYPQALNNIVVSNFYD